MLHIQANNVSDALSQALLAFKDVASSEVSRNGGVLVYPTPVMTEYLNPQNRVLFSKTRDANPFFHLMESLWMLAGRNDLAWVRQFNSKFGAYSDDGVTIHGAYGHRWINHFGFNQLKTIAELLKTYPNSRRAVLSMWDARADLMPSESGDLCESRADVPCNTQAYFDLRGGVLNMTVVNRSNDVIWGAYGANAVHFSVLLEVMAAMVGVPMGVYRQFSNNLHIYPDIFGAEKLEQVRKECRDTNVYYPKTVPIVDLPIDEWFSELDAFMEDSNGSFKSAFLEHTAKPVYQSWMERKAGTGFRGSAIATTIHAPDWADACMSWINRRGMK